MAEEPCLYYNNWLIVFFYINNIIAAYQIRDLIKLKTFKEHLIKRYKIKDLGKLT